MTEQATTALDLAPVPAPHRSGLLPTRDELERMHFVAKAIAASGMPLPANCRTAESVLAKILIGWEHGLGPMTSMHEVHIIEGKASLPSAIKTAIIRQRGMGSIDLVESTDERATVRVQRADWAADRWETLSYSMADAKRAGLDGKQNWRKYPRNMLSARVHDLACHLYFQEAFMGLPYSPDELGADTDADGRPLPVIDVQASPALPRLDAPPPPPAAPMARPEAVTPTCDPPAPVAAETTQAAPPAAVATAADPVAAGLQQIEADTLQRDRYEAARGKMVLLRWNTPTWRSFLSHHFGVQKFSELKESDQQQAIAQLERLLQCETLRKEIGVSDAQWATARGKRGCEHDWQLSPEHLVQINGTLADRLSPFRRQELGIWTGQQAGPVAAGIGGNESGPTVGVAAPSAEPSPSQIQIPF